MLLERNQAVVGAIVTVVLVAGSLFALVLQRSWISRGTTITALFTDAAGLQARDDVMVAGVRAGQVEGVFIEGVNAAATLQLSEPMPRDSRARIVLKNFLGKRAVVIDPGTDWDHPFQKSDTIPVERTSTPVDYAEFNKEAQKLSRLSDIEALRSLLSSVADVSQGQREQVGQLIEGLDRVTRVVSERRTALSITVERSKTVVDTLADKDQDLVRIIDAFGSTLDRLAKRRADLSRLLAETAKTSNQVANLVGDQRQELHRVLAELHEDLEIIDRHQVDLAHIFAYGGQAFTGFSEVVKSGEADNPYWANVFTTSLGPVGVDAFAGCNGVLDQMFDRIFGPDPRTCAEQEKPAAGSSAPDENQPKPLLPSIRSFFGPPRPGLIPPGTPGHDSVVSQ